MTETMFATVQDLGDWLGRPIDEDQRTRAELMLRLATGAIRRAARQTISRVDDHAVVLHGNWSDELWLPERPVIDVTSLQIGSDPVLATTDYEWGRHGLVVLFHRSYAMVPAFAGAPVGRYWGGPDVGIAVTYSHGFDEIPEDVRAICLAAAGRAYSSTDAGGVPQEAPGRVTLLDDEKRDLMAMRPRL